MTKYTAKSQFTGGAEGTNQRIGRLSMETENSRQEASELRDAQSSKSPVKILSSSPPHQKRSAVPLSDYSSPVKGPKSIASFFIPPAIQSYGGSSLKNSPVNISNLKNSPVKTSNLNESSFKTSGPSESPIISNTLRESPGKLSVLKEYPTKSNSPILAQAVIVSPQKHSKVENSESDLTISESDDENVSSSGSESDSNFKITPAKAVSSRSIPFNYSDSEDETEEEIVGPKRTKKADSSESETSDISVIISLPSTDSNDLVEYKPVMKRFVDFSNSDYESFEEDEINIEENDVGNIPIILDSLSESESERSESIGKATESCESSEIPLMIFNPPIEAQASESPRKKSSIDAILSLEKNSSGISFMGPTSTDSVPVKQPKMPEKVLEPSGRDQKLESLRASCKQAIAEIERKRGVPMTEAEIRDLLMSSLSSNPPPKPQRPVPVLPTEQNRVELARKLLFQNSTKSAMPVAPPSIPVKKIVPSAQIASLTMPHPPRVTLVETAPAPVINSIPNYSNFISNNQPTSISKTGFVYDERMLHHFDPQDPEHPEKPARINSIYEKLRVAKLLDRSRRIPIQVKPLEFAAEVQSIHDVKYCRMVNQTSMSKNIDELHQISSQFNSVYFNPSTAMAATVAAAATIELCDAIGRGEIENGFAIVRPPGHHAEHDEAMGFCIYNNVAVAASSLLRKKLAKRIIILDWDVHHGNGTQNAFADSGDVLYVSLHRYDGGKFYPHIEEANHNYVGTGAGLGKSVNVAWNGPGFGDADYLFAFNRLIMPIAREFNPDFVIVSAGFDAAAGDPIGECELTTFGYSMMIQELMTLAGGKLALVLEGGYNLDVISKCYEACVRMLLKEAPPCSESPMIASPKAIFAIENSVNSHSPYWKCLFPKPALLSINDNTPQFPLSAILDQFWREECKKNFNLNPIAGLFRGCSDSIVQKYSNRILASEGALFNPEVLIIFAHESGPIHTNSFVSSLCLQSSKINQSQPFLPLLQALQGQSNYNIIDINLPNRIWKLKQTSLGNETEGQELNVIFSLLWDQLISRSGCRNVFFVAAGTPIYSIGHLINTKDVENQIKGCYFFSSSLFIPIINSSPKRSEWYQRNSQVIVPSQEPIKRAIGNAPAAFGSCFSAGQWLMADSAAAVGDFKMEILNFIRTRLQKN